MFRLRTDLAVVELKAVEERVDNVVDGLLEDRFQVALEGRPAADLLEHEARVQRQTALGQGALDHGQLPGRQGSVDGSQTIQDDVQTQLGSERSDADEVTATAETKKKV